MTRPHRPLVSVLVPAYQAQATLGGTISSILTQTYPSVEIIVVDDGSTDATVRIAEAYGDAVRVVTQENSGTAAARNRAIEVARGDFLALCDADDVLLPPYLDAAMDAYERSGGGRRFVTSNAYLLTAGGIAHGRKVMADRVPAPTEQRLGILEANFVSVFTLMPAAMAAETGGFRPTHLEDWDLWLRAIHAGWEAVAQPEPHALYRWSDTSKSTQVDAVYAAEDALLAQARIELADRLTDRERDYLDRRLAGGSPRLIVHTSDADLRSGDFSAAAQKLRLASSLAPSNRGLRIKAASMRYGGYPAAKFWQTRLRRIDSALGRSTDVVR